MAPPNFHTRKDLLFPTEVIVMMQSTTLTSPPVSPECDHQSSIIISTSAPESIPTSSTHPSSNQTTTQGDNVNPESEVKMTTVNSGKKRRKRKSTHLDILVLTRERNHTLGKLSKIK